MSKKNGFLEKLPELMQQLCEVKAVDCEPFDGTFQVDGGPFEVRLKPNATIEDVERIANHYYFDEYWKNPEEKSTEEL